MGGKKKKQVNEQQLKPKAPQIVELMDKSDMDKTEFISFMPEDGVYPDRTYMLKGDKNLKVVMRELLKQLNWLRYLSFKQFWATVQFNFSLKYCLQSCLLFLQRRKYNEYIHLAEESDDERQQKSQQQQFPDKPPGKDEVLQYQKHIYQILLIVYFRILQAEDENPELAKQFKCSQSVYDNWIMDIPKLFNFMEIYGESNPQITKILVQKVFTINSDYKLDFIDVLNSLSKHVFPDIFQQFKLLHDRSEFQKQINEDTLRKKMKHFLVIKDITTSFVNIFEFFPIDVKLYAITSLVLGPLQNIYYEIFSAYKNWQFNQFKQSVHSLMDSIQVDIIKIWVDIFGLFRTVILEETNMSYIQDFYSIKQLAIENMNVIGEQFGIVASQGKKGREKRNYMLLEQVLQQFDLLEFLNQLIDLENKNLNKVKLKQLLNVVEKLTQLKQKRKNPDLVEEVVEQKKQEQKDKIEPLPEIVNIRKQSTQKIEKAESKQQKQDKINSRMQRIRKPLKLQKTNEREYDDEYDDYYDFNRKIQQNAAIDSDDQIEEIPQNPNRKYNNNKNDRSQRQGEKAPTTGGRYQEKNSKQYEKKGSKETEKPESRSFYRQSNNRGDDSYKRGDKRDNYKPTGTKKPQYRQK